jgi:hypothetical protein
MSHRLIKAVGLAIGIVCGLGFAASPLEAQLRWFGFSDLCFDAQIKAGGSGEGDLTISISDIVVKVRCDNVNTGESCQPGGGNAGHVTLTVDAATDPAKEKGVWFADGCLSLDRWDHHRLDDGSLNPDHCPGGVCQNHLCLPLTNKEKEEVPGSAHIEKIIVEWVLTTTNASGQTQIKAKGNQECDWPGTFNDDPLVCAPQDNPDGTPVEFVCVIDTISKGKK